MHDKHSRRVKSCCQFTHDSNCHGCQFKETFQRPAFSLTLPTVLTLPNSLALASTTYVRGCISILWDFEPLFFQAIALHLTSVTNRHTLSCLLKAEIHQLKKSIHITFFPLSWYSQSSAFKTIFLDFTSKNNNLQVKFQIWNVKLYEKIRAKLHFR